MDGSELADEWGKAGPSPEEVFERAWERWQARTGAKISREEFGATIFNDPDLIGPLLDDREFTAYCYAWE